MPQEEVDELTKRKSFLYQSRFPIDNLTAILMDTTVGGHGLIEETARAKAHRIMRWIDFTNSLKNHLTPETTG